MKKLLSNENDECHIVELSYKITFDGSIDEMDIIDIIEQVNRTVVSIIEGLIIGYLAP